MHISNALFLKYEAREEILDWNIELTQGPIAFLQASCVSQQTAAMALEQHRIEGNSICSRVSFRLGSDNLKFDTKEGKGGPEGDYSDYVFFLLPFL